MTRKRELEDRSVVRWMAPVLRLAAAYNILWGAIVVAFPAVLFDALDMRLPAYPQIWQCVGMIVGVYGVGYAIASTDPMRHCPIVFVGLLGKILGPIGFVISAARGDLPWKFGVTIITNDLIWWVPFGLILHRTWRRARDETAAKSAGPSMDAVTAMQQFRDQEGRSLEMISRERPTLVLFLRHLGCTFCRETLSDLVLQRPMIEASGVRIAIVHMSDDAVAATFLARYELADLPRISDRACAVYRAFELERGGFEALLSPRVLWRGLGATLDGHFAARLDGDAFQMPGAFVVRDGRIVRAYRHKTVADRPDLRKLACASTDGSDDPPLVATQVPSL